MDIKQLMAEGIAHIRRRPGMYIGGTDQKTFLNMLDVILTDSAEEVLLGRCDRIYIELRDGHEFYIADNGLGLNVDFDQRRGVSHFEHVMRMNGVQKSIDSKQRYDPVYGIRSVNYATVNALSTHFQAETIKDGFLWRQSYELGQPQTSVEKIREANSDDTFGIMLTFRPDFSIFQANAFDKDLLISRCEEIAYTTRNVRIQIVDKRNGGPDDIIIQKPQGLRDLVVDRSRGNQIVGEPYHSERTFELATTLRYLGKSTLSVEVALQFSDAEESLISGYVNTKQVSEGGAYLLAAKSSIESVLELHFSCSYWLYQEDMLHWEDVPMSYHASISIFHPDPQLTAGYYRILQNADVYMPIAGFVFETFLQYVGSNKPNREMWKTLIKAKNSQT